MIDQRVVAFGVRIVKACRFLQENKKEFVLSKQVLRSGTAIGAMVKESEFAESKADFVHKLSIALKGQMKRNIGCFYCTKVNI